MKIAAPSLLLVVIVVAVIFITTSFVSAIGSTPAQRAWAKETMRTLLREEKRLKMLNMTQQQQHQKQQHPLFQHLKNKKPTTGRLIDQVDTRFGSGGSGWGQGSVQAGPQVPHGAMRMSPISSLGLEPVRVPFQAESGYSCAGAHPPSGGPLGALLGDSWMEGFAHTSVVGAGEADWQNFLVTAIRLPSPSPTPADMEKLVTNAGYKSKFQHASESAAPGSYSVTLDTWNVDVELAAVGTLSGMSRFTCAGSDPRQCALVLDLCHGAPMANKLLDFGAACKMAQVLHFEVESPGKILVTAVVHNAGSFLRHARGGALPIYAYFEIEADNNSTFGDVSFFQGGKPAANATAPTTSGMSSIVIPMNKGATIRTALSFVSATYARLNFRHQNASMSFDNAVSNTQNVWEEWLGRFSAEVDDTSSYNEHVSAFTNTMYRYALAPTIYNEWDGSYIGLDYKQYQSAPGERRVSDLSLWDIYRSNTPLLYFSDRALYRDLVNSMTQMTRERRSTATTQDGRAYSPKWVMANVETDTMVGLHGCTIMSVFALQQLSGGGGNSSDPLLMQSFDDCVGAVRHQNQKSMPLHGANGHYSAKGGYGSGVGGTLEYTINAAAVRNVALALGNQSVADEMAPYASASSNLWNAAQGMFCDREASGAWSCPGEPIDSWLPHPWEEGGYVESNAQLYKYYQPGDLKALTRQFGNGSFTTGAATLAEQLYFTFLADPLWTESVFNSTLPSPFFWLGNEPAMLPVFQSSLACGGLSAVSVSERQACNSISWIGNHFQASILKRWFPAGWTSSNGNEDYGAMSMTGVLLSVGLYPVPPGEPTSSGAGADLFYVLVAPVFRRTQFTIPGVGTTLLLVSDASCKMGGVTNNYLANATVNGVPLQRPVVSHKQLTSAAATPTVVFYCAQKPVTFYDSDIAPWTPPKSDTEYLAIGKKIVEGIIWKVLGKLL